MLKDWEASKDKNNDMSWCVAETCAGLGKRLADLERKVRVLGDAFGIRQPPAEPHPTDDEIVCGSLHAKVEELIQELRKSSQGNERLSSRVKELEADLNATRDQCDALEKQLLERDEKIATAQATLDEWGKKLASLQDENAQLTSSRAMVQRHYGELQEENASLMAKAEAMAMELESHRARRTGDGALLAEVEELKIKQYDLRDALRDVLSQIGDIRRGAEKALDA